MAVWSPDGSDTVALVSDLAAMASSVDDEISDALSVRQAQSFIWDDAADRSAQLGMTPNSCGVQLDDNSIWTYLSGTWRFTDLPIPAAYTPTWTNLTIGNGTQGFKYTVAGGRVHVSGYLTLGTTTTVSNAPYFTLPRAANGYITGAPAGGAHRSLGTAILEDPGVTASSGQIYTWVVAGVVYAQPVAFIASGTYVVAFGLTDLIPHTWGSGDFMTFDFSYIAD